MDEMKKNSVLVVDDEKSNIMALSHILSPNYTVYTAKNGQSAIIAAEKYLPDVILLDIIMPDIDGYTVIAALKSSEKTQNIPVIFITGLSNSDDEEKGLSLGAADYIGKPFSAAIVKLRVQNQIKIINQTRLIIEKETTSKSNRARSEFLSRMSHEMRTPMNAIMGMTALAKNTAEIEKRDDMLEKISASSRHLLRLIDDVLDMSNIEDNNFHLHPTEFSFAVMIREILNITDPDIKSKQQSLTTDIDPSIPDTLTGDKKRLEQVILNLLSNACKFTPEQGSIQINAFGLGVEDETLAMQIEVVDNGIGIHPDKQETLFLPFEQVDGGRDRKFGGVGLGLTISKYIVELMEGEISVESEPDRGTKFIFTIKMQLKPPEIKDDFFVSLDGKTALLAEDIEVNREIIIAMLEDTGLKIECAENGREALDLFTASPDKYNVILMDINMPEMDGIEATRRIRALDKPEGARVPIIAITANILMSEVNQCIAAGMNDHIGKPVDFDKLLSKLNKYLNNA